MDEEFNPEELEITPQLRKRKYTDFILEGGLVKVAAWARDGDTDLNIAKKIGISRCMLHVWKQKYPEFAEALRKSRMLVDIEVENALFSRATGSTITETIVDSEGNTKTFTKQLPPDVTAQIFWLKNRKPKEWRDKRDVEIEGKLPVVIKGDEEIPD